HGSTHRHRYTDYQRIEKYLRELGFRNVSIRAFKSNPSEISSVDAVQRLFLNNHLNLCKRCTKVKKSLMATTWKKGVMKIDKPNGEPWTHHSDALKYFCYQEAREFMGTADPANKFTHIW